MGGNAVWKLKKRDTTHSALLDNEKCYERKNEGRRKGIPGG